MAFLICNLTSLWGRFYQWKSGPKTQRSYRDSNLVNLDYKAVTLANTPWRSPLVQTSYKFSRSLCLKLFCRFVQKSVSTRLKSFNNVLSSLLTYVLQQCGVEDVFYHFTIHYYMLYHGPGSGRSSLVQYVMMYDVCVVVFMTHSFLVVRHRSATLICCLLRVSSQTPSPH